MRLTKIQWLMLAVFAVLLCVSGCSVMKTPPVTLPTNPDWTIDVAFQYNFANIAPCSSTVTTSCVSGFTFGYLNGSTLVPVKTTPIASYVSCPSPLPAPATGSTLPDITCQQPVAAGNNTPFFDFGNSLLPIGGAGVIFYVVPNYVDQTGAALIGPQAVTTQPQIITANGATGLQQAHH